MQVKCEFADRGCQSILPLTVLVPHSQDCAYRPVSCRNPGCSQTVNLGQLVAHETDECEWRPVGICQRGCGLVLLQRAVTAGHECVEALKNQIGEQEIRTGSLETEMRRLQARFVKREKSLLAQIATLHGDVQLQALNRLAQFVTNFFLSLSLSLSLFLDVI
ncbi:PDZRN3_4 [Acanthosepion pharaonis]|uniref:PDZRN3_4 n=1 Tax=Acanthosepion pharaonis TaxID=158019 RepID=A0A812C5L2_ACAPH|nr:PDZRN3_4 [Sepia pharaonis]